MESKKITNKEVKRKNRNRIYRYLRKGGICSNPDIAYELNLSLPTVTQNTKELLEMGLIEEKGELESTEERQKHCLFTEMQPWQQDLILPEITLAFCSQM